MFIQFFEDHIYIERLGRCELKGGETLDIIEKIAKQLGNISYISLEDDSTLKVYPEFDIWINLYIYKILTKGKSWYNSLEYYSNNYTEELEENAKFKTMTIKEFQEDVSSSDINKKKYKKHYTFSHFKRPFLYNNETYIKTKLKIYIYIHDLFLL